MTLFLIPVLIFVACLEGAFLSFSKKLLLWGSPAVIQKYENFRKAGQNRSGMELLGFADDVFRAMRADLGLSNDGLGRGDLIKLFLSDPENLDKGLK